MIRYLPKLLSGEQRAQTKYPAISAYGKKSFGSSTDTNKPEQRKEEKLLDKTCGFQPIIIWDFGYGAMLGQGHVDRAALAQHPQHPGVGSSLP